VKGFRCSCARLAHAANPIDLILVSTLAISALPVSAAWTATVWFALVLAATFVLRRGSRERASELSRAELVSTQGRLNKHTQTDRLP
jgi:hypothetical protein